MIVRCEIRFADIGTFDPQAVRVSLGGDMFAPLAPGYPRPFPAGDAFLELLRPSCGKRAVGNDQNDPERLHPGRLLTPDGPFEAGRPESASQRKANKQRKGARAHA